VDEQGRRDEAGHEPEETAAMRRARLCFLLLIAAFLCACQSDRLTQDVRMLQYYVADVQARQAELQAQIGRFDGEDWRDVVPEVRRAAEKLNVSLEALATCAEDARAAAGVAAVDYSDLVNGK